MTQSVKIGWKKLEKILNDTIKELNAQKPLKGDGISVSETATGTIISTTKRGDDKQDQQQQGGNAPSIVYIQNTQWQEVTLVDPATCIQSTAKFLAFVSGGETQFNVTVNADGSWTLAAVN